MKKAIVVLCCSLILIFFQCTKREQGIIMTVKGPIKSGEMGVTLTHEHILVDFIGADSIDNSRWNRPDVVKKCLPFLLQIRDLGCRSFIECTPDYLGRDPLLLKELSELSGLNILTNTGYYGAGNNKYLPQHAFSESPDQLADRWTSEWENGIDGTGIRPGFIKIGVAGDNLSDLHKKLVRAAARTHLRTGLTIASHTGPAHLAFQELEILQDEGVAPEAFVWVHAQNEKEQANHVLAGKMGAWVSFDGISENNLDDYVGRIRNMKDNDLLNKVLLSHDAGWYRPGEENGGAYRGYTTLFEKLVPALLNTGFSEDEIDQMLVVNPAMAFTIKVRKEE